MSLFGRALFGAAQTSRTLWFGAQYSLAQRLMVPPLRLEHCLAGP